MKIQNSSKPAKPGNREAVGRPNQYLNPLIDLAYSSGASDAKIISPDSISVNKALADFCIQPRCKHYGLSPGCPPHVSGPGGFVQLKSNARHAMVRADAKNKGDKSYELKTN